MTVKGVWCVVALSLPWMSFSQPESTSNMWTTGYYPRWAAGDMPPRDIHWTGLTHVIHFGANPVQIPPYLDVLVQAEDSLQLQFGNGWVWPPSTIDVQQQLLEHAHRNNVKVLLSVGGIWGDGAKNMDFIAADDDRLQKFVSAASAYARRKGYDGIEIDWEPPSSVSAMTTMIRSFREQLDRWTPRGILAIAAANGHQQKYDPEVCNTLVDQVNIMMYDFHMTPSWVTGRDITYYNAPLGPSTNPSLRGQQHYMNEGPAKWIKKGFHATKLGLGIPFYGYCYRGKSTPAEPRGNVWPQYIPYPLVLDALKHGGTRYWDEGANVPWAAGRASQPISWYVNAGEEFYITYEDSMSIDAKVRWAQTLGLGGIMIYELWQGWNKNARGREKDPLLEATVVALYGKRSISGKGSATSPDDITALGTPIALVSNPGGMGNRDLEVLRDGHLPPESSTDPTTQYDTYSPSQTNKTFDWIGYEFASPQKFSKLLFHSGMRFPDGGWFERISVQVRVNNVWHDVKRLISAPTYDPSEAVGFKTYVFEFYPVIGEAIRIAGEPGGGSRFFSASELRVFRSPKERP
jgi:GH18 family chitinase